MRKHSAFSPALLLPAVTLALVALGVHAGEDPAESDKARAKLKEQFLIVHDMGTTPGDELAERIEKLLAALSEDEDTDLDFLLTNSPDADAGCLAGQTLFMGRGLAARLRTGDELAAALALAHSACKSTGALWENRSDGQLPDFDDTSGLMEGYQDYRIEPNTALYNQLVARGCGEDVDCLDKARTILEGLDVDREVLDMLLARVAEDMPEAALFERHGKPEEVEEAEAVEADEDFIESLGSIYREKESMDNLRQSRESILEGELRPAYQAYIRSGRSENTRWIRMLHYTRLNLINLHPEYGHRDLARAREDIPDYPHHAYFSGWAYWQQRRPANAVPLLQESLEVLPQASTHYYLGLAMNNRRKPEQALEHFRIAAQAGEISSYGSRAAGQLEALKKIELEQVDPEDGD